jgi:hypothetical protein
VAQTFNKVDAARYTRYMDQCLREVEAAAELETDALLVQLVRIQRLSDRVHRLRTREPEVEEVPGIPSLPVAVHLRAYGEELERLRGAIPEDLRDNGTM